MRFTLDQIEAFVQVARHGSFSAAGRAIGRAQSTVSASIANLEIALGAELFDRSSRNPSLTPAGRAMLIEAQSLYDRSVALESHGDSLAAGAPSSTTLAVAVPHQLVRPTLTRFAAEFPHTDVQIRNPEQGDATRMVLAGEAGIGVTFAVPDYGDELAFSQLGKIIMSHVVHSEHPLAAVPRPTFDELRNHRRIVYDAHAHALPTSEYLQTARTWTADSYEALIALVTARVGWATIPRLLVGSLIDRGVLTELYLEAYPFTDWIVSIDLIWQVRRRLNVAEQWLVQDLKGRKISERSPFGQRTTR